MKNSTLNILKTMLKTSYDVSGIINEETGKINKKSIKVWALSIFTLIVVSITYIIIGFLKKTGIPTFFLDIFFMLLEFFILLQAITLTINIIYFSEDIKNYIYMPISGNRLFIIRYFLVLTIILATELLIAVPSIFIYANRTLQNISFYFVVLIVLLLITVFLTSIIVILTSILIYIFKFIKEKKVYKNLIFIILELLIVLLLFVSTNNIKQLIATKDLEEKEIINTDLDNIEKLRDNISINKVLYVPEIGIKALSQINAKTFLYLIEITIIDVVLFAIILFIGKKTYLNRVLYINSLPQKTKKKKPNLEKKCIYRKKEMSYLRSEFKTIIKSQIYLTQYLLNIGIIMITVVFMMYIFVPFAREYLVELEKKIEFDFEALSLILILIQILFTFSAPSLTAFSRYGANAKFFKYIPIKYNKQFYIKMIPGIIINMIIIAIVLVTFYILIPGIGVTNILYMFIISILLNINNNYLLLFIDLWRPQLHLESEISIIKQNENTMFKYILTTSICLIIWYIKEITEKIDMQQAILIAIIIHTIIFIILNTIVIRKKDRIFKNII